MTKVIVWGNSLEYDWYRKVLEVEVLKGNMEIVAIALNEEDYLYSLDDIEIIKLDELPTRDCDYIIDMNMSEKESVKRILELLRIPREKVIPISLFEHSYFDLKDWIRVKQSNITIVSQNCWGGITYNSLGLKFGSPFVNMWFDDENYLTMLENLEHYMNVEPHLVKEAYDEVLQHTYPVVGLDDVCAHFNHYTDFEAAIEIWNRRKQRINYNNILVEMVITSQKTLDRFLALPYEHKIGFSYIPCKEKGIVYLPYYENKFISDRYQNDPWGFITRMAVDGFTDECRLYEVLKLLNHEENFMRAVVCHAKNPSKSPENFVD